jgi:hypothetical protein
MLKNEDISTLLHKVKSFEDEMETRMAQRRAAYHVLIHNGKVAFEHSVQQRHRELKTRLSHYILGARPLIVLTAPFIYLAIVPLLLLDLCVTLYQGICFPVYGIQKVKRADT